MEASIAIKAAIYTKPRIPASRAAGAAQRAVPGEETV